MASTRRTHTSRQIRNPSEKNLSANFHFSWAKLADYLAIALAIALAATLAAALAATLAATLAG